MLWLLPLLIVPGLALAIEYRESDRERFTWKELRLQGAILFPILVLGFVVARWSGMRDTETWSGSISGKDSGSQSCCHCTENCTGSGDDEVCITTCDHSQDYWWTVDVSTGDTITIDSCNPSPSSPSQWSRATNGMPAVAPRSYTNYLLARPEAVLSEATEPLPDVPSYPSIYGYEQDRAVRHGIVLLSDDWTHRLDQINTRLGADKQVNVILFATSGEPVVAQAVEHAWLFGKKNDLIVVVGTKPDLDTIRWAEVVSISAVPKLREQVFERLPGRTLSDVQGTGTLLHDLVEAHFERRPLRELGYLAWYAKPSVCWNVFLYLFALIGAWGGARYMRDHDVA